jgi:hypothetical protein
MATPPRDDQDRRPSLEPTRPANLAVAALITTALAWLGISSFWGSMPTLPWLPPLTLLGLAIVEAVVALNTKNRIDRKAGAGPIEPLVIARYAVLAKASAMAGALFAGLFLGMTSWLLLKRGVLVRANDDLPQAILGIVGSAALVVAALALERACRVPPSPDQTTGAAGGDDARTKPTNGGVPDEGTY